MNQGWGDQLETSWKLLRAALGLTSTISFSEPLPFGTFAEAKDHAEESHQIPIMGDFPYWDNDWLGISNRLLAMIGGGYRVFSTSCGDDMKIAAGCLEYLSNQSGSKLNHFFG